MCYAVNCLDRFMSRHCPATCGWCEKEYLLPKQIPSGAKNDDIADQSANQSSKNAQSEPPASNPKQSHFERTGPIIFTSTSVEQKFSTTFKPDTTIEPMSVSEASTSTQPGISSDCFAVVARYNTDFCHKPLFHDFTIIF